MIFDALKLLYLSAISLCIAQTDSGKTSTSSPNEESCFDKSRITLQIQRNNGMLESVEKVPWKFLCLMDMCKLVNGTMVPVTEDFRNISVEGTGWYGVQSPRHTQSGRLVVFETKNNHSDDSEIPVNHGCEGTMHMDYIPSEPWIALIRRGICKFTQKLENAISHGAQAAIIYNHGDKPVVIMNNVPESFVSIMVDYTFGVNILTMQHIMETDWISETYNYTSNLYVNITHMDEQCKPENSDLSDIERKMNFAPMIALIFLGVALVTLVGVGICYAVKRKNKKRREALNATDAEPKVLYPIVPPGGNSEGIEMQEMPATKQPLLSPPSQATPFGSLTGSQLLTDGENVFLFVPNVTSEQGTC